MRGISNRRCPPSESLCAEILISHDRGPGVSGSSVISGGPPWPDALATSSAEKAINAITTCRLRQETGRGICFRCNAHRMPDVVITQGNPIQQAIDEALDHIAVQPL